MMRYRADQGVPGEQRMSVQEGDHPWGTKDDLGGYLTGNDSIEHVHGTSVCLRFRQRPLDARTVARCGVFHSLVVVGLIGGFGVEQ